MNTLMMKTQNNVSKCIEVLYHNSPRIDKDY